MLKMYSDTENVGEAGQAFYDLVGEDGKLGKGKILTTLEAAKGLLAKCNAPMDVVSCIDGLGSRLQTKASKYRWAQGKSDNMPSPSVLNTFFSGLPVGWSLGVEANSAMRQLGTLKVPAPPFKLRDNGLIVEFSNLLIRLDFVVLSSMSIVLGKQNQSKQIHKGPTSRWHPHSSSSGYFCLGDASSSLRRALESWDIISAYQLFLSLVKNYRRGSAYQPLDSFTNQAGLRCRGCSKWILRTKVKAGTESPLIILIWPARVSTLKLKSPSR